MYNSPTRVFRLMRRHCSTIRDGGVQFKTAEVFNESAIFSSSRFVHTEPPWQDRFLVKDSLFQAMRKNRQEPFWSVPAVVYIVLPDLVKSSPFREQTVG